MEKPLFSWARPWSATRDKLRNSLATRVGRLWLHEGHSRALAAEQYGRQSQVHWRSVNKLKYR